MTAPLETRAQRWARLHRRIKAAGRVPAMTLEGCERQAAMLDSGELQPLPAPSEAMRRVMNEDDRRRAQRAYARMHSEDVEAAWTREEHREAEQVEREFEAPEWPYQPPTEET